MSQDQNLNVVTNDINRNDPPSENQPSVAPETQPQAQELSPRKLASVRANAQKSTGPKTPEGLAKCTAAATAQITHGMLAKTIVIQGESEPRFLALLQAVTNAFHPITEPEHAAVLRMVVATWRQLRVWAFQSLDINREIARQDPRDSDAPPPFRAFLAFHTLCEQEANTLALAHRYETTYERQYYRALKSLQELIVKRRPAHGVESLDETDAQSFTLGATWLEPHPDTFPIGSESQNRT